jgi:hypothetical protein
MSEYRCPGENYTIPVAVCRARQRKGYEKCPACSHRTEAWYPNPDLVAPTALAPSSIPYAWRLPDPPLPADEPETTDAPVPASPKPAQDDDAPAPWQKRLGRLAVSVYNFF